MGKFTLLAPFFLAIFYIFFQPCLLPAEPLASATSGINPANISSTQASITTNLQNKTGDASKTIPDQAILNPKKLSALAIFVFLLCCISYFLWIVKTPDSFFVRRIPALDALEHAIGKAAETGKPMLFVPGIRDVEEMQTMAAMTLLGKISTKAASIQTPLFVPVSHSFTMTIAQEVIKRSHVSLGKSPSEALERISYLSDDQFAFAAGVIGLMNREKPATCFFFGYFLAESLILAEAAAEIGSTRISGTAEPAQIPFFIVSCDYTLMGEELFAASACISRSHKDLATLKTLDLVKIMAIIIIIIGCCLKTFHLIPGTS
ncbi:MAG: hypothetical protein HQM08_22420 [Candidatus Riflebacteria bacterium]|nr:hypothetical protein [Candidatus Riflebacteria bacterium]